MQILKRLRDISFALLPIVAIVLFVHFFLYQFETMTLIKFLLAIFMVGVGEVMFLTGVDSTIMPMGDLMVNAVNRASKLVVFVVFAVLFGVCATVAEPDVTVFSQQVIVSGLGISKTLLMFIIGAGVGIFIAFGIIRLIKHIKLKFIYIGIFAIIFVLCFFVKSEQIAIAFDAGGATTGIVTAPFLLAITAGINSKFSKSSSNKEVFGMVGLASFGPVVVVLLLFALFGGNLSTSAVVEDNLHIILKVLMNASLAIIPLAIVFFVYDLILIKLPVWRKVGFAAGLFITFLGLLLFLFGIEFGISEMGTQLGNYISTLSVPLIIVFCLILGFVVTFSEPSVIVLSKQVQSTTKGNIPYILVMISIAISMAFAISISALKIVYSIKFEYIVLVGYLIAVVLMIFVPDIFTNLAFDSGGVASGPMTTAFLLPIMIAMAAQTTAAMDGFGLIGIVSMCPIVVLQIFGLAFKIKMHSKELASQRNAIRVSYSADMYSNIEKLEAEYNKMKKEKRSSEVKRKG